MFHSEEGGKMSKRKSKIVSFLLHFLCILGLFIPFAFIARYYLDPARFFGTAFNRPLGVDFYQFLTYASYVKEHLNLPILLWKTEWFTGIPFIFDYAWIHFYLAAPFVAIFKVMDGSKIYLLLTLFLFFVSNYFLFYELSKNRLLALLLDITLVLSASPYLALYGGGNSTFSANLFFVPLSIYLVVKYYHSQKRKFLFLSILSTGFAFLGHPAIALMFVFFPSLLFLFFWWDEKTPLFSLRKIFDALLYLFIPMFIGAPTIYQMYTIGVMAQKGMGPIFAAQAPIEKAIIETFSSNNIFIYLGFGFLLLFVLLSRSFKTLKKATPFLLGLIFILIFEWLYKIGKNPAVGPIGPGRTFWFLPLMLACLSAIFWNSIREKLKHANSSSQRIFVLTFGLGSLVFLGLFFLDPTLNSDFINYVNPNVAEPPQINKVFNSRVSDDEKKVIIEKFIPSFIDTNDKQHRFFTINGNINIWWNILYSLPLYHGYYSGKQWAGANWSYWTNMVLSGEQVYHWKTPLQIAKNQALFLIDWQSIKYLYDKEAEIKDDMQPLETNEALIASYLSQDQNIMEEKGPDQGSGQRFWKFKESVSSKIVRPSNSPTLLVIGDDISYDSIFKILAMNNLNSKYIIPIHGPEYADDIQEKELKNFDMILLYRFKSGEKGWKTLERYVREGGKLIIETNDDRVKESDSKRLLEGKSLPSVFPISETQRDDLGKEWEEKMEQSKIFEGVDIKKLAPLDYDGNPWKLSYTNKDQVRNWGEILLSQKDNPILVSGKLDQGIVIWSGMSLPYHLLTYHNESEIHLFENILNFLVTLKKEDEIDFEVQRPQSENIKVTGNNFKGVILGENAYGGWVAKVNSSGKSKKLKIYKAGPDFMYVRLPQEFQSSPEVKFNYRGSILGWFLFILGVSTALVVLKRIFIPQKPILSKKIFPRLGLKREIKDWWWKDDEA